MITVELKSQMIGVVRDWNLQENQMTPDLMVKVMKEALRRMDELTSGFLWGVSERDRQVRTSFYESLYNCAKARGEIK